MISSLDCSTSFECTVTDERLVRWLSISSILNFPCWIITSYLFFKLSIKFLLILMWYPKILCQSKSRAPLMVIPFHQLLHPCNLNYVQFIFVQSYQPHVLLTTSWYYWPHTYHLSVAIVIWLSGTSQCKQLIRSNEPCMHAWMCFKI